MGNIIDRQLLYGKCLEEEERPNWKVQTTLFPIKGTLSEISSDLHFKMTMPNSQQYT